MTRKRSIFILAAWLLAPPLAAQESAAITMPAPQAGDWTAIAALPDLSGTWSPDLRDQFEQEDSNPPAWKPEIAEQVAHWLAEEQAGRPKGLFIDCLPHGMPSQMTIPHNAMEILLTPGRVTILGESDGNRLRRIWTDGRAMPADADPSFNGYSVGHWEGDTLVVDTAHILPQTYIAISEAVGIPNNGGMTITERIHLIEPDTMAMDLVINAPAILERPWETRRLYHRARDAIHEIAEGVCRQGDFFEAEDEFGNASWEEAHTDGMGNLLPPPLDE
jgi:hypothetical protein